MVLKYYRLVAISLLLLTALSALAGIASAQGPSSAPQLKDSADPSIVKVYVTRKMELAPLELRLLSTAMVMP